MRANEIPMQNPLWSDIHTQRSNLARVVAHLFGEERASLDRAARFLSNDRPIYFVGVASAAYLCSPAEIYLGQHGKAASVLCASDAYYSLMPALRKGNVVINSRSGETAEVVKLAVALEEEGVPFVAITNEPGSTLAGLAQHVVYVGTHQDDLVSINVVTGMMTATLALAAAVCGELDDLRPAFELLGNQIGDVVDRAVENSLQMQALFQGVRPLYLLYRGHSKGAALCGRLALEEIARTPSVALEAAEFRQGPNEVIDARFGAIVFCGGGKQGELNRSLARDIQRSEGRVLLVGESGEVSNSETLTAFPLLDVPDMLRPVLEIVPVQVLAFRLAEAQGYTPGEARYITRIILSEFGIPSEGV